MTEFQHWGRQSEITSYYPVLSWNRPVSVQPVSLVKWFGWNVDTAVLWPQVWAVFGVIVGGTDWPMGIRVWPQPVDTRRMKACIWSVNFLVSREEDKTSITFSSCLQGRSGCLNECDKALLSALIHCKRLKLNQDENVKKSYPKDGN